LPVTLNCSSCGGAVVFASRSSASAVCPYCQSMLVRHDLDVEAIGKVAMLQQDFSPLQIGSEGHYAQKDFTLVGRIRRGWASGYWFEWAMDFGDDREAWLAEAQGSYAVNFLEKNPGTVPELGNLAIGQMVSIAGKPYQVHDRRETFCEGAEGALPYPVVQGQKAVSVDLSGSDKRFATLEYGEQGVSAYVGEFLTLPDLRMKNMRELDGW